MTWDGGAVLYAAARWAHYLAAFLLIGVVVFRLVIWRRAEARGAAGPAPDRRLARIGLVAAGVLLAALGARLYLQARSLLDPDEAVTGEFLGLVLGTGWGTGWIAQVSAGGAALVGAGLAGAERLRGAGWAILAAAGGGLVLAAPWTGHAVAIPEAGRYGWLLDALHFGSGAVWLGTLAVLVAIGLDRRAPAGTTSRLVSAFSPVALVAGLLAMSAGLLMGYRYLGGVGPLFTSDYGGMLLIKLGLLAVVAALGAYHWRVALPRLRAAGDAGPLRKTAVLEAGVAALLLAATAVVVALPLPGEH